MDRHIDRQADRYTDRLIGDKDIIQSKAITTFSRGIQKTVYFLAFCTSVFYFCFQFFSNTKKSRSLFLILRDSRSTYTSSLFQSSQLTVYILPFPFHAFPRALSISKPKTFLFISHLRALAILERSAGRVYGTGNTAAIGHECFWALATLGRQGKKNVCGVSETQLPERNFLGVDNALGVEKGWVGCRIGCREHYYGQ